MFFCLNYASDLFFYFLISFQIILESLPVSSSGHLKLLKIINKKKEIFSNFAFLNYSLVKDLLYIPTIFVILIYFYKEWVNLIKLSFSNLKTFFLIFRFIFIVEGLTLLFYILIKSCYLSLPVYVGFFITSLALYYVSDLKETQDCSQVINFLPKHAIFLGLAQGVAIIPGISRFGFTYSIGRILNYKKADALFLSFFIELPIILALSMRGILKVFTNDKVKELVLCSYFIYICAFLILVALLILSLSKKIIDKNMLKLISFYLLIPMLISFIVS